MKSQAILDVARNIWSSPRLAPSIIGSRFYRLDIHRQNFAVGMGFIKNQFRHIAGQIARANDALKARLAREFREELEIVKELMKVVEPEELIHRHDVGLSALPAFVEIARVILEIGAREIAGVMNDDARAATGGKHANCCKRPA